MYSESLTISGFASCLERISLSSFNEILYLVQEYESICELRGNEMYSIFGDSSQNSLYQDYEFVKGEEYLWALIKELVTLFIAESKLPASTVSTKNEDESLHSDFQFLYWSAIQNWLQKLRKKTTRIASYEENASAHELSFHSLFQTVDEKTSNQEAELLKTMFDAFRCGAFDDESVESQEDWNRIFDGYSNIWRQCSLNGASAPESIRDSFHQLCRSFRSDNIYECILYSIHTAESIADLQTIEFHFKKLYEDSMELSSFDLTMDIIWSCVTCLLYQLSLRAHHQHHGSITQIENYTREKIQSLCSSSSLSCQYLGYILNNSFSSIITHSLPSSSNIDELRLHSHCLLLLHSIYSQIIHTSFSIDPSLMNYPTPFSNLRQAISYSEPLFIYLQSLAERYDVISIFYYIQFFNESQQLSFTIQLIYQLFLACLKEPYQDDLTKPISPSIESHYILGKILYMVRKVNNMPASFCKEFYHRVVQFILLYERKTPQELLCVSRFLCLVLYGMNESEYSCLILECLFCIWNQCVISASDNIVSTIRAIMEEEIIQRYVHSLSVENEQCVECITHFHSSLPKQVVMALLSLYSKIHHCLQYLGPVHEMENHEKKRQDLSKAFTEIQGVLDCVQDNKQCFLSLLMLEWNHCASSIIQTKVILSTYTSLTCPSNKLQKLIQPSLAKELALTMRQAFVSGLYKPC